MTGKREAAEDGVRNLLTFVGEDDKRDGLLDTPKRVVKAMRELTAGYGTDIASLFTTFENDGAYSGMVVVKDIPFHSLCEHHMLPFTGLAHVAYLPGERIVGLSKIARVVEAFARRLQVQERMTTEVHDALVTHLKPEGVMVVVEAEHFCMAMRGIQKHGSRTVTTELSGAFEQIATRDEAFRAMGL